MKRTCMEDCFVGQKGRILLGQLKWMVARGVDLIRSCRMDGGPVVEWSEQAPERGAFVAAFPARRQVLTARAPLP